MLNGFLLALMMRVKWSSSPVIPPFCSSPTDELHFYGLRNMKCPSSDRSNKALDFIPA